MRVHINGEDRELTATTTVAQVVRSLTEASSGIAVALNDTVVPRREWETTRLREQDRVDVLTAVQGG